MCSSDLDAARRQAIREALMEYVVSRRLEVAHRFKDRLGQGFGAATGVRDVANAFVTGQVDTLLLDPDDHFYGTGERFLRLDLVGRTVHIWNRNPYGARSALAYKNIPFVVGSRGYGLFVDVPTSVTFHLGSRSLRTYSVEAVGPELDSYVIAGTPKEIVSGYTELTGRPPVPPD